MKLEIDFIYQSADKLVLSGWVATKNPIDDFALQLQSSLRFDGDNIVLFPRKDVCEVLHLPVEKCSGFIGVVDFSASNSQSVLFKWGNDEVEIDLSNIKKIDSLEDIDDLAKGYEKSISDLLIRNRVMDLATVPAELTNENEPHHFFDFKMGNSRIHLDQILLLDSKTIMIFGWILKVDSSFKELRIKANNVVSDNILEKGLFFPRPDVLNELNLTGSVSDNVGVVMTIVYEEPVNTKVELVCGVGDGQHLKTLPVKTFSQDEIVFTEQLLSNLNITSSDTHESIICNIIPAINAAWSNRLRSEIVPDVRQFGQRIQNPKVSIIIPIYGRYDFVQHQMAQFSLDKEFDQFEVIYVLDDPRIRHEFLVTCHGVHEMFGQPFTTVISPTNLGFAGANNLGFKSVTASKVLFINSDVLPKSPGWVSELCNQFDALDNVGILGATLLYEDNTVQHRGMEFCKDPSHDGLWMNYHPQKGFPISFCEEFKAKKVQCVTGACMLMETDVFQSAQGFDVSYILGDFEDSDLCIRITQMGLDIYVSGTVELFHLERLSQNVGKQKEWKHTLSMINGLQHTQRWNSVIENLVGDYNV